MLSSLDGSSTSTGGISSETSRRQAYVSGPQTERNEIDKLPLVYRSNIYKSVEFEIGSTRGSHRARGVNWEEILCTMGGWKVGRPSAGKVLFKIVV
jgi:hypothetical protein